MRKFRLLFILSIFFPVTCFSQINARDSINFTAPDKSFRIGITAGFLLSRLEQESVNSQKFYGGFQVGGIGQISLSNKWSTTGGISVAFHGTNFEDSRGYGYRISSVMTPVMIGYRVIPNLQLMAGVQPEFITKFKTTNGEDLKDHYKNVAISLKVGGMYNINKTLSAQISYAAGISDYIKDNPGDELTSRIIEFSVLYWF